MGKAHRKFDMPNTFLPPPPLYINNDRSLSLKGQCHGIIRIEAGSEPHPSVYVEVFQCGIMQSRPQRRKKENLLGLFS